MKARNPIDNQWCFFIDKCLPFGSSISCKLFQEFSNSIAHIVQWKLRTKKKITNYLDDFLFVALLKWLCNLKVETFLEVCKEINFPVNMDKTYWANTNMTFLGFLLDTVNQMIGLPVEKLTKGKNMLDHILNSKKIKVRELQRVTGFLNFLGRCIIPGRAFTRRLYSFVKPEMKPFHHINVNKEMKIDISLWRNFLEHPSAYARPFADFTEVTDAVKLDFYTDASKNPKLGFGGKFGKSYFYHRWDEQFIIDKNPSIAFLELYAATAGIIAWITRFKSPRVVIFIDNEGACSTNNNNSFSGDISLWEGVVVLKGPSFLLL